MNKLRWLVKDDGTKALQFLEQTGPCSFKYVDVPTEYDSPLARYNETALFKAKREDIETSSLEIGNKRYITMKHFPSGFRVESSAIVGTFEEREDLLKQLLNKIKQHHEKINS